MYSLYQGDCLKVMDEIPDGAIDLVLCDPPYGTTSCKWDTVIDLDLMWSQLKRVIKKNGAIVLFGSEPFSSRLRMSNIKQYKYDLVWDKLVSGSPGTAKYRPMPAHENILIFGVGRTVYNPQMKPGKPYVDKRDEARAGRSDVMFEKLRNTPRVNKGTRFPTSVFSMSRPKERKNGIFSKTLHPTQKPVALMEYLIRTYTNPGETVLDFTMGSGTTGVAARRLARYFIGIELDDKYFQIAKNRIENV